MYKGVHWYTVVELHINIFKNTPSSLIQFLNYQRFTSIDLLHTSCVTLRKLLVFYERPNNIKNTTNCCSNIEFMVGDIRDGHILLIFLLHLNFGLFTEWFLAFLSNPATTKQPFLLFFSLAKCSQKTVLTLQLYH